MKFTKYCLTKCRLHIFRSLLADKINSLLFQNSQKVVCSFLSLPFSGWNKSLYAFLSFILISSRFHRECDFLTCWNGVNHQRTNQHFSLLSYFQMTLTLLSCQREACVNPDLTPSVTLCGESLRRSGKMEKPLPALVPFPALPPAATVTPPMIPRPN